jgi:glycerol-3-phosphate dehydrogenase
MSPSTSPITMVIALGLSCLWPLPLVRPGLCMAFASTLNILVSLLFICIYSLLFYLTPDILDIEAEVRYAVRHEYAQTAIDVIARRTRLSFLNARAALDALPRVVDIMAEELNWSRTEKAAQLAKATSFLESMGLSPAVLEEAAAARAGENKSLLGKVESVFGRGFSSGGVVGAGIRSSFYSRAQFQGGEVESLRGAFEQHARPAPLPASHSSASATEEKRLSKNELSSLLRAVPGYESITEKEVKYVLDEAGFAKHGDFDFDEFVEVSN